MTVWEEGGRYPDVIIEAESKANEEHRRTETLTAKRSALGIDPI